MATRELVTESSSYQIDRLRLLSRAAEAERDWRLAVDEAGHPLALDVRPPGCVLAHRLLVGEQFLRGLRRIVFSLYMDLASDGRRELAQEALEEIYNRRALL